MRTVFSAAVVATMIAVNGALPFNRLFPGAQGLPGVYVSTLLGVFYFVGCCLFKGRRSQKFRLTFLGGILALLILLLINR